MTRFSVIKKRIKREEPDLQRALVRALRLMLPGDVCFFHVPGAIRSPDDWAIMRGKGVFPGVPDLVFVHRGVAFGLELENERGVLSAHQRAAHVALRDAGMRIEVARSFDEALECLREFGIPLRVREAA